MPKRGLWQLAFYPLLALTLGIGLVVVCGQVKLPYAPMRDMRFMLNFTYFGRCAEFVCGMALALWMHKRSASDGLAVTRHATLLGGGGILLFTGLMAVHQAFQPGLNVENWPYGQIFANNCILPVLVCLLFYGLITERTALQRLLETRIFDLLGKSSYIFYLIHLGIFDTLFARYISHNIWVQLVAYTLASIALYKLIEHPLHLRLRAKPLPA